MKSYKQRLDYTCGPAIIRTLLNAIGTPVPGEARLAREMKTTATLGTSPQAMVRWLKRHNYAARIERGGPLINRLLAHLKRGSYVIIDWALWGGHYCLVVAYKRVRGWSGGQFTLADPAAHYEGRADGLTYVCGDNLAAMWFSPVRPKNKGLCIVVK